MSRSRGSRGRPRRGGGGADNSGDDTQQKAAGGDLARRGGEAGDDPPKPDRTVDAGDGWGGVLLGWSAPLPPPAVLQQYETQVPGAAERVLAAFDEERRHRHKLELMEAEDDRQWLETAGKVAVRGQLCGFALALLTIGGGVGAVIAGAELAGAGTALAGVAGVAAVFVVRGNLRKPPPAEGPKPKG